MSKIMNIGFLDVSEIKEGLAREITEIENIGLLIESEDSQILLKDAKKMNIGSSIKIPIGEKINVVPINGSIKIDRDYLEGLIDPIVLLVNGMISLDKDIDKELINEKIYMIMLNGKLVTPKSLSGIIQSKGQINGETITYKNDYIYFDDRIELTNRFLKSLKPNSKLAIEILTLIEDIDLDLLKDKISNIQVLNKLVTLEKYEDILGEYIDEFYDVELHLIPEGQGKVIFIEGDIKLNNTSIERYKLSRIFVDGEVEIDLNEDIIFKDHIEYMTCDKLICNLNTFNIIKDYLGKEVEVEVIRGKLIKNNGKLVISNDFNEEVTIKNTGKLVFEEGFNIDNFNQMVVSISNYGVIQAPEDIVDLIKEKTAENFGKIKVTEDKLQKQSEEELNIMYSNTASLKL